MFKSKSQCNTLVNLVSWNGDKMFRFFVTGIVLIAIAGFSFGAKKTISNGRLNYRGKEVHRPSFGVMTFS
jgi:hypothetical protein